MTLGTSLSSIIIEDNIIDQGSAFDGVNPQLYTYDTHIFTSGSAVIRGNTLSNPTSDALNTSMVELQTANCIITDNRFIRGSASILNYITDLSTYDQIITDNLFDSPTTDGTSKALVAGISTSSIYRNNLNQTPNDTTYVYALNTQLSTTSISFINTNLTIPVNAFDVWFVDFSLTGTSSNSGHGCLVSIDVPSGASITGGAMYDLAGSFSAQAFALPSPQVMAFLGGFLLTELMPGTLWGLVICGSSGGNITLQIRSYNGTETAVLGAKSVMRARQINAQL